MRVSDTTVPGDVDRDRLARLEERIARLEALQGLSSPAINNTVAPPVALSPVFTRDAPTTKEEFEFELGQHWFARAGVLSLTAGLVFLLSLPYRGWPAAVPSLLGLAIVAALLGGERVCRPATPGGAGSLRAAAMILLCFSALRLFFFGPEPVLNVHSPVGQGALVVVIAINFTLALRHSSAWLTLLALVTASGVALAAGTTSLVFVSLAVVTLVTMVVIKKGQSPSLLLSSVVVVHVTYLVWAMSNPLRSQTMHFVREPAWAPGLLLGLILLLGIAPLLRGRAESVVTNVVAFMNCALGYGAFLAHTAAAFPSRFAAFHLAGAVTLIGLAMIFFVRSESRVSIFFYAMTGYAALSATILNLSSSPEVFVWLSVQSVIVVATAVWFRSRFIVVANFFIFAAIVVTYVVVTKHETGISVGLGLVAIVTARILNWKQHRLELKTELMRNAYLASAFTILPYAAYHLVPVRYVALVWIALAAGYYLVNVAAKNQKYRWMGHGTLILTMIYVTGTAVSRFEPIYRVLSFLVLGVTLYVVSLFFARARRRQGTVAEAGLPHDP
jgi:hypothetical protein